MKTNEHSVATYTVLCILKKMRDQMGLEAMIEYLEKYLETIETYNPKLKMAYKSVSSPLPGKSIKQNSPLIAQ